MLSDLQPKIEEEEGERGRGWRREVEGEVGIIYTSPDSSNGFSKPPPHVHLSLCLGGAGEERRGEGGHDGADYQ